MDQTREQPDSASPPAEVLYGVAGWSYSDWEGIVYPKGASGETKLLAVAAACDLVEVNTTFYQIPPVAMTAAWPRRLNRAGLNTRMAVKLNRVFTHEKQGYSQLDVRAFKDCLAPLDDDQVTDRLGRPAPRLLALLAQFPFYFAMDDAAKDKLARLAEDFPRHDKVLEVRHRSWATPESYAWIARHGYSLANIDLPARTAAMPKSFDGRPVEVYDAHAFPQFVAATGPVGYLRLHGRNADKWFDAKAAVDQKYNYLYTPEELNDLAERVRELAGRSRSVAVVGNNHYRGKAVATVLNLANLVEGRRATLPPEMLEEYPQLKAFASPGEPVTRAMGKEGPTLFG